MDEQDALGLAPQVVATGVDGGGKVADAGNVQLAGRYQVPASDRRLRWLMARPASVSPSPQSGWAPERCRAVWQHGRTEAAFAARPPALQGDIPPRAQRPPGLPPARGEAALHRGTGLMRCAAPLPRHTFLGNQVRHRATARGDHGNALLDQDEGAGDVGVDEIARPVDRPVDMGFGGEMHHDVGLVGLEAGPHHRGIGDVGADQMMTRMPQFVLRSQPMWSEIPRRRPELVSGPAGCHPVLFLTGKVRRIICATP